MNNKQKLLKLKLDLYHLLNEMDEGGTELSESNSEILHQLINDPELESLIDTETDDY